VARGPHGAVGCHRPVGDRPADLGSDRRSDAVDIGGRVIHPPAGPIAVQPVSDVEVLFEVVGERLLTQRIRTDHDRSSGMRSSVAQAVAAPEVRASKGGAFLYGYWDDLPTERYE
jgi:hypothetical protein